MADAPSPSPPPSAPEQVTPGPRAVTLTDLYTKALSSTVRTCSYDNFASCFPTPAARTPKVLRTVWEQITAKINSKGRAEFDAILQERRVVQGLNGLETLLGEARARREAGKDRDAVVPPHTMPPDELLAAHLAPQLAGVQAELQSQLTASRARNEELADTLRAQRDEIEKIVRAIEDAVEDVTAANRVLDDVVVGDGGLREEAKGLRADLKTVDGDEG